MKKDIHPKYGRVIFRDINTGDQWIGSSTKLNGKLETMDGEELPVVPLDISSQSHPFYTGKGNFLDTEGRIDRFKKRFAAPVKGKKATKAEKAANRAKAEEEAPSTEEAPAAEGALAAEETPAE